MKILEGIFHDEHIVKVTADQKRMSKRLKDALDKLHVEELTCEECGLIDCTCSGNEEKLQSVN